MIRIRRVTGIAAAALLLASTGACSAAGGLGSVLGSVLGGAGGGQQQGGSQVSGTVRGVDTRNQQIGIQQSNGQQVSVAYDQNTQVVYQNQNYQVSNLENGDQVTLRIQQLQNGGYYTDLVQVDRSVSGPGSTNSAGNVVSLEGTVRAVDQQQGLFSVDIQNGTRVTVSLPSQLSRGDITRFQNLRSGEYVRFYGVYTNNTRAELRQFY